MRMRMRTLTLIEHLSLDGVVQVWPSADFPYGDSAAPFRSPADREAMIAVHGEHFDMRLDRRTYDGWSMYWPSVPRNPMGDSINAATENVDTHRPEHLAWVSVVPLGADVADGIRLLKSQPGCPIIACGSASMIPALLEHGMADKVLPAVYPVRPGCRRRLLVHDTPAPALRLVGNTTSRRRSCSVPPRWRSRCLSCARMGYGGR